MLPRILCDSRAFMLRDLADAILTQLRSLWLRLTVTKGDLSPSQMMTFLGMVWDSTSMQEWQSPAWVESILTTVKDFRLGQEISVCQYQKLLGLMAATANVISLGLLYTRPFKLWLICRGSHLMSSPLKRTRVSFLFLCGRNPSFSPWFPHWVHGMLLLQDSDYRHIPFDIFHRPARFCLGQPTSSLAHKLLRDKGCIYDSQVHSPGPEGLTYFCFGLKEDCSPWGQSIFQGI